MSKKKLNIVLDIGKTNVKLVFLDQKGQFFKEIKTTLLTVYPGDGEY